MKYLIKYSFIIVVSLLVFSCSGRITESDLVGHWEHILAEYDLYADGTYDYRLIDHGHGEWHLDGDSLHVGRHVYHVDSMRLYTEHGIEFDALYLTYTENDEVKKMKWLRGKQ